MKIYLAVNALLYLVFAVWCLIKMNSTSHFLGYSFNNNSGRTEYLTIYTGLQIGFAVFLMYCAIKPEMALAGLIFCVCLYICIILTRTISAFYFGAPEKATYIVGTLEYVLAGWGTILLCQQLKN